MYKQTTNNESTNMIAVKAIYPHDLDNDSKINSIKQCQLERRR